MSNDPKNQADESRRQFIPEWAAHRNKRQKDIVKDLGIDKGLVSKWFNKGVLPGPDHLASLAEYFAAEEAASLLRHPNDDWLAKFFRDKTEEQKEAAIQMLQLFFSQISGDAALPVLSQEDRARLTASAKMRIEKSDEETQAEAKRAISRIHKMRDNIGTSRKRGN